MCKGVTLVLGTHPWLLQGRETQKEASHWAVPVNQTIMAAVPLSQLGIWLPLGI